MKCCICGTVRNCGKYLEKVFSNIEKIGSIFDDYVIIVYYDKSNDNTLDFLKEYKTKNSRLVFYVNNEPLSNYRTHRISKGRNMSLNMARNQYTDYEYFIMMDFDDINAKEMDLEVLKSKLSLETWDALSFVNVTEHYYYYDIWALSIQPFVVSFRHFKNYLSVSDKMHHFIDKKLKETPKEELIPCASAFGGFSIYRIDKFVNCNYSGKLRIELIPKQLIKNNLLAVNTPLSFTNSEGSINEDCEHKSFHLEAILKNNARIRISPEKLFY